MMDDILLLLCYSQGKGEDVKKISNYLLKVKSLMFRIQ